MGNVYIVANWKSNKTTEQAEEWFHNFSHSLSGKKVDLSKKEIIICPGFSLLERSAASISNLNLPLKLGVQDISKFSEGAYTGEVNGIQIAEFADYVLVGHSERRKYFKENEEVIKEKLEIVKKNNLTPILCISQSSDENIGESEVVAYEPLEAIGTGNPDTPENASKVAGEIKEINQKVKVLYGGSVTSENVNSFTEKENISGILVGGASLEPLEFAKIVENA